MYLNCRYRVKHLSIVSNHLSFFFPEDQIFESLIKNTHKTFRYCVRGNCNIIYTQ